MGLDLSIMKEGKASQNKKGQWHWTVTKLCNLRNVWEYLKALDLENCKTECLTGLQLWEASDDIENENEKRVVQDELKDARIKNSSEVSYSVEAWW